jgi:hypothetical protein
LGGQRQEVFRAGEWQMGAAYRRLTADEWYVGTQVDENAAPFGRPLYLNINSLDFSVTYGVSNRVSVTLTLPFSHGTHDRFYSEDSARHKVKAFGLGDVSLVGTTWLLDPATHLSGNIALGLGVKAPTGDNEVTVDVAFADSVRRRIVDQSIQLGDGGWGVLLQAQAYRQVFSRGSAYFFGSYLLSPKEKTNVPSPIRGVPLSVPDVYTVRGGLAYAAWPEGGLSLSLGVRLDGIPLRDIMGGDDGFRRPGYTLYLDPGLALGWGRDEFTVSFPISLSQDFRASLIDRERGLRGGGDLAEYLIFAAYTHRF